jgi:serine/threonine protein kinase
MAAQPQTAEDIFFTALDLPSELRLAYVDSVCRESDDLHTEVIALLADHQRMGDFLEASPILPHTGPGTLSPVTLSTIASATALMSSTGWKLGRYTIVAPLGVGGAGAVYRARDERLEREVAIKVLFPDSLLDERSRARFRKESLALARLHHPNIAAVHDVGDENGVDYIVMECVSGENLAAKLQAGPLAISEALTIARQVAGALEEAHHHGVIHRDLKPANIMITSKGIAKVLDFGIARLSDHDAAANPATCIGTPSYMSPEQAQGRTIDARTDLWSLGVVLYQSLTGCTPFRGESMFTTMQAILEAAPAPMATIRPEVPPAIQEIVTRLLQKDAATRFQTAQEVVQALTGA